MHVSLRGLSALMVSGLVALGGGCGDTTYSSYHSVEELRLDAVRAGLDCPTWTRDDRPDGTQAGSCSAHTRLFVYTSGDALDSAMEELEDTADRIGMTFTVLVGENWVVNDLNAAALQEELGGEVVSRP
jgi:hypothetical protein